METAEELESVETSGLFSRSSSECCRRVRRFFHGMEGPEKRRDAILADQRREKHKQCAPVCDQPFHWHSNFVQTSAQQLTIGVIRRMQPKDFIGMILAVIGVLCGVTGLSVWKRGRDYAFVLM